MKLASIDRTVRVAICIPCRDTVHSAFTYHLIQLVQYCHKIKIHVQVLMETGSLISSQRQGLAQTAIDSDYTHILWLDSDMLFPPNTIETLLGHRENIVACNYSTRTLPLKGVAYRTIGDWDSWVKPSKSLSTPVAVEGVGMGCMLVSASVFRTMPKPWFEISWNARLGAHIGEDFYFCQKAYDFGFQVYVDTQLSNEIIHLGTTGFDLSRTVQD